MVKVEEPVGAVPRAATREEAATEKAADVTWLARNLDKILAGVVALVISVVAWFFTELRNDQAEIAKIKQSIAVLEEKMGRYTTIEEERTVVSSIRQEIATLNEKAAHYATTEDEKALRNSIDNTIIPDLANLRLYEGQIRSVETQLTEIRPVLTSIQQYEGRIHTVESQLIEVTTTTKDVKETTTIMLNHQLEVKQGFNITPVNISPSRNSR